MCRKRGPAVPPRRMHVAGNGPRREHGGCKPLNSVFPTPFPFRFGLSISPTSSVHSSVLRRRCCCCFFSAAGAEKGILNRFRGDTSFSDSPLLIALLIQDSGPRIAVFLSSFFVVLLFLREISRSFSLEVGWSNGGGFRLACQSNSLLWEFRFRFWSGTW